MGRSYRAGLHAELEGSVTDPFTEKEDFGGCGSDKSDRILSDDFPHTVIPDYHDGGGVIAQSNSVGLLKSVRRSSDVPTRIADPCPTCLTPQTTNRLSQVSRRGTFSEDVRMQSTPRKQLQFYNSCSDSKRDAHRLPASPAFRQIQRCSGQCTHGEVEERDVHWDSIQHENQYHVQNDETLIQDLKSLTNGESSDSAGESISEECQAENEKMVKGKKGRANCSRALLLLLVCAVVIVALLLTWWKEGQSELYVVPT